MADAYDDLVNLVADWSNRDSAALSNSIIQAGMRYAADTAYRDLKIPALEYTVFYVITDSNAEIINNLPANTAQIVEDELEHLVLTVPTDLSTFIHLRKAGSFNYQENDESNIELTSFGAIDLVPATGFDSLVWNEKTDVRTFHDMVANKVSVNYWARQGNYILASDYNVSPGDVLELFYYRRLPALNARYTIDPTNETDTSILDTITSVPSDSTYLTEDDFNVADQIGQLIPHWLRDNEKIILFGALWHCFDYLGEDDMSEKYLAKFVDEINNINKEELIRKASGGNVQVHYNSNLI